MFEELRTFVEVAESKNFTRTAQKLNFSQPTVSQQVKKVEIFFGGTSLLTRSAVSRQIELTEAGEAVYRCAKKVLGTLEDTFGELDQIRHSAAVQRLEIGASMTIGDHMLPRVLAAFCGRYPDVRAGVLVGNTREVCDALEDGRIDVGLIEGRDIPHSFQRTDFYTDHLVLAASPALAGELGDASPGRLGKVLWITREQGSGTEQYLDSFISSNHIRVENRIEYNSNFAIKEVVKQGLGVCFLSRLVMLDELRSGELVELPVRSSYTRDFSYILPNDRPSRRGLRHLFGGLTGAKIASRAYAREAFSGRRPIIFAGPPWGARKAGSR